MQVPEHERQMCVCVCMCVSVHECGCVCVSVPVSMSIQVLCERVCISVDVSMNEREHLCMCIFELTGGDCALEKHQSSGGWSSFVCSPTAPFPSWPPPASETWLCPVVQRLGQPGASEWVETETKLNLCPWHVQTFGLCLGMALAPRDHSWAMTWDSSEGARWGCCLGRGLSLEA